jgi:hypothetical protein
LKPPFAVALEVLAFLTSSPVIPRSGSPIAGASFSAVISLIGAGLMSRLDALGIVEGMLVPADRRFWKAKSRAEAHR